MKKLILICSTLAAVLCACVLLLFLVAPRIVNTDIVRSRVSSWIADKTGGLLTYRRADVSFFPLPRMEVFGISGAIPRKGTYSAASVTVYLSLLPLLSGEVDVTKVVLEKPEILLDLTPKKSTPENTEVNRSIDEFLAGLASKFTDLVFIVDDGTIGIMRESRTVYILKDVNASFSMRPGKINADLSFSGGFARRIQVAASFEKTASSGKTTLKILGSEVDISLLRKAAFKLIGDNPIVGNVFSYLRSGKVRDLSVLMTGGTFAELGGLDDLVINGRLRNGEVLIPGAKLLFQKVSTDCSISRGILHGKVLSAGLGNVEVEKGSLAVGLKGPDALFHLEADTKMNFGDVPRLLDRLLEKRPFPLDRLRDVKGSVAGRLVLGESVAMFARWKEEGNLRFTGRIRAAEGPVVDLALAISPGKFEISRLNLREERSDAELTFQHQENAERLSFAGHLDGKTVDKLIDIPNLPEGFVDGNIQVSINEDDILLSKAEGNLSIEKLPLRLKNKARLDLEQIRLKAEGGRVAIESAVASISDNTVNLSGFVDVKSGEIVVDLDASAERIRWETLKSLFEEGGNNARSKVAVTGSVRVRTGVFQFGDKTVSRAQAEVRLEKERTNITIETATLRVDDDTASVSGAIDLRPRAVIVEMDVNAKSLKWGGLKKFLIRDLTPSVKGETEAAAQRALTGTVRFTADTIFLGTRKISLVHAVISLLPNVIRIRLSDEMLCGISVPGSISIAGKTMMLYFRFKSAAQELGPALACLAGEQSDIAGKFVLKGSVRGKGKIDQIVRALDGRIDFKADGGRINKSVLLLNVYSLLNVTGYLSGNIADLFRKGISYRSIIVKADVRDGKVILREATLDAPSIEIVATGEIDLPTNKIDLRMLAVPLTTVNVVLGKVPVIGKVVSGSLVSVPITVTGDLNDPVVNHTTKLEVGSGLVELMKKVIRAPFTVAHPERSRRDQAPGIDNGDNK